MKIIGVSLVHNDKEKGWLQNWLETNSTYFDKWIILDDSSDDGTAEEIKKFKPETCEIIVGQTDKPLFKDDEIKIRTNLWNLVREYAQEGDWVLVIDSDELITNGFKNIKNYLVSNSLLVFKKQEMWNEIEHRTDGLWSNYFERMFPFKDVDFGYSGRKGFHYPATPEYAQRFPRINTNIAINHLAYQTEELRKTKYDFMMNNSQQKKDLNWYHFQTIHTKPKLSKKNLLNEKILITISFVNLYKVHEDLKKIIEYSKDSKQLKFKLIVSNSSIEVYNDVIKLSKQDNVQELFVSRLYPEMNRSNRLNETKQLVFEHFEPELQESDHIFFIDGEQDFNFNILNLILGLEKNLFMNFPFNTILYFNKEAYNQLPKSIKEIAISNMDFVKLLSRNNICWIDVAGMPRSLEPNVSPELLGLKREEYQ